MTPTLMLIYMPVPACRRGLDAANILHHSGAAAAALTVATEDASARLVGEPPGA